MKYLVIGKPRPIPIPPDQAITLYNAAIAWADNRIKTGKLDCLYVFPQGGGMAIGNVNSQEEAFDELLSYPLFGFFDWEVDPLTDWKHAYTTVIEMYQKMGAK
jgi:muconolactone delta-isomerase